MKTFSVAQGNVFLPIGRAEGDGEPIPGVTLEFSEDPNDSSQCRLRLVAPDGRPTEAVFHRNGALLHTLVRDLADPAKPFETVFQTEERRQREAKAAKNLALHPDRQEDMTAPQDQG